MSDPKRFLWEIWAKKVIRTGVQAVLSAIGGSKLAEYGVRVDPVTLSAALYTLLEGLRNWLKAKKQIAWL